MLYFWFYHGLNSVAAMLLFTIVLLHTILCLALVFWFSLQMAYAENRFCVPWYSVGILALYMHKFCFAGSFKFKNNKTTN